MGSPERVMVIAPILAILLFVPNAASGHAVSQFYDHFWESDLSVRWKFVTDFPSGDYRARMKDGAQEWNNTGQPMFFDFRSDELDPFPPAQCPQTYQKNGIHWGSIEDPDVLAATFKCFVITGSQELFSFQIKVDQGKNWYTGIGNTPDAQFDLWSVASHEFGHATGWSGHLGSTTQFCTDPPKHTMCPALGRGASWMRSIEEHDIHTFSNAY